MSERPASTGGLALTVFHFSQLGLEGPECSGEDRGAAWERDGSFFFQSEDFPRTRPGARTPVDRTKSSLRARGNQTQAKRPFRKRNPKRPRRGRVQQLGVCGHAVGEQNGPSVRITRYRNLRVEGSVSNTAHANLRKIGRTLARRRHRRILLYGPGDIQRRIQRPLRELDHVTIKGRAPRSKGPSAQFDQDIGEDLGVHLSTQDSAGVTVYTEKDYLHSHRDKRGVLILAPNFIDPQGDANFAPATSISRPGYTKIKPDRFGVAQSTRQGLSDHRHVCLPGPKHRAPIEDGISGPPA
ncbi:hypothetical protein Q5P01_000695 [Channa striata]|uniref:Uncharacterized protein n=1 Tax=Channa striata TaxID=64152 RepID=A0AA88IKV5_CHASR|nr:hypothetical protein Q5P01_000695 [Channa striata]